MNKEASKDSSKTEKQYLDVTTYFWYIAYANCVSANLQGLITRGQLNQDKMKRTLSLLKGTLDYEDLKDVDMVIEVIHWPLLPFFLLVFMLFSCLVFPYYWCLRNILFNTLCPCIVFPYFNSDVVKSLTLVILVPYWIILVPYWIFFSNPCRWCILYTFPLFSDEIYVSLSSGC